VFADVTNGMTIARKRSSALKRYLAREVYTALTRKTSQTPNYQQRLDNQRSIGTLHGAVYGCLTLPWGESAGSSLTVVRRQQRSRRT
jgi:hypothetical protein